MPPQVAEDPVAPQSFFSVLPCFSFCGVRYGTQMKMPWIGLVGAKNAGHLKAISCPYFTPNQPRVCVNYVNVVDGTLLFHLQTDWLLLLELRATWCGC